MRRETLRSPRTERVAARGSRVRNAPSISLMQHQSRHWTIESDVARIDGVVTTIVDLCEAAGYSSRHCRLNIPVAVTEALSNAIVRGNASDAARDVRVSMVVDSERLFVEVVDEGQGFDLSAVHQSPDDPDWFEREDGRGVFLMRQLMDRVESEQPDGRRGHRLRLILYRA